MGGTTKQIPTAEVSAAIAAQCKARADRLTIFFRLHKSGEVFYSKGYTRVKKRNSYTVRYRGHCFGQTQYFAFIDALPFAAISKFLCTHPLHTVIPFISDVLYPIFPSSQYDIVDIRDIDEKCIFVHSDSEYFIVRMCNACAGD